MKSMDKEIQGVCESMARLEPRRWADVAHYANAEMTTFLAHEGWSYAEHDLLGWGRARSSFRRYSERNKAYLALKRGADFYDTLDTISKSPQHDFSDQEAIQHRARTAIKIGLQLGSIADAVGHSILSPRGMAEVQILEKGITAAVAIKNELEDAFVPWDIAEAAATAMAKEFRTEDYRGMVITYFYKPRVSLTRSGPEPQR